MIYITLVILFLFFIYAYNFFINYHIVVLFLSLIPLSLNTLLIKSVPNYWCIILLVYWGLNYIIFTVLHYNVYMNFITISIVAIFCWFKSLGILYFIFV